MAKTEAPADLLRRRGSVKPLHIETAASGRLHQQPPPPPPPVLQEDLLVEQPQKEQQEQQQERQQQRQLDQQRQLQASLEAAQSLDGPVPDILAGVLQQQGLAVTRCPWEITASPAFGGQRQGSVPHSHSFEYSRASDSTFSFDDDVTMQSSCAPASPAGPDDFRVPQISVFSPPPLPRPDARADPMTGMPLWDPVPRPAPAGFGALPPMLAPPPVMRVETPVTSPFGQPPVEMTPGKLSPRAAAPMRDLFPYGGVSTPKMLRPSPPCWQASPGRDTLYGTPAGACATPRQHRELSSPKTPPSNKKGASTPPKPSPNLRRGSSSSLWASPNPARGSKSFLASPSRGLMNSFLQDSIPEKPPPLRPQAIAALSSLPGDADSPREPHTPPVFKRLDHLLETPKQPVSPLSPKRDLFRTPMTIRTPKPLRNSCGNGAVEQPWGQQECGTCSVDMDLFADPVDPNDGRFRREFCNISVLGRGQFSTVYKAVNLADQHEYAIKVQRRETGDSQAQQREVFALARVAAGRAAAEHLVRYYSSWWEDEALHIQLEMCACSLRTTLDERRQRPEPADARFDQKELLVLLRQVSNGLAHLHSVGFAHLDVKPDNILLVEADADLEHVHYKVADFGLVTSADVSGSFFDTTEGDGRYVARELLEGSGVDLPKADVFSLGLVCYEALTNKNQLPVRGEDWHALRQGKLLNEEQLPEMSQPLLAILRSTVAPPKERPTCAQIEQKCISIDAVDEVEALRLELKRAKEEAAVQRRLAERYRGSLEQAQKQQQQQMQPQQQHHFPPPPPTTTIAECVQELEEPSTPPRRAADDNGHGLNVRPRELEY